jgi:predicted methyltransferase
VLAAFVDDTLSLPFGGFITHIFAHLGIEPEEGEHVITSIATFDKKTIAKSFGQVEHHIRRQDVARNPDIGGASLRSTTSIPQDVVPMMLEQLSRREHEQFIHLTPGREGQAKEEE